VHVVRVECKDGQSFTLGGGSPLLADIFKAGAGCPSFNQNVPGVVMAAADVMPQSVEAIAQIVAQTAGQLAISHT
jgi:hypothetical protein